MPRDYKNIKKEAPKKESIFLKFMNFVSGLSVGLLVAVIVFFYGDDFAGMLKIERASVKPPQLITKNDGKADKDSSIPEPTFEFYNILPNKEVDISAWVTEEAPLLTTAAPPADEGNYILQVGSFKQHSAADQVKAKLALLGFQAYIEPGVINGEGTFRVRIGPYSNLAKIKLARKRLLDNNLDFMQMRL